MAKTEEEICKECKGNCCRSMGCSLSPEDMIRRIRAWKEISGAERMQHRRIEEAKTEEIMSEKDKMLAGELYDANYDKELIKDRYKAKDVCFEYNR